MLWEIREGRQETRQQLKFEGVSQGRPGLREHGGEEAECSGQTWTQHVCLLRAQQTGGGSESGDRPHRAGDGPTGVPTQRPQRLTVSPTHPSVCSAHNPSNTLPSPWPKGPCNTHLPESSAGPRSPPTMTAGRQCRLHHQARLLHRRPAMLPSPRTATQVTGEQSSMTSPKDFSPHLPSDTFLNPEIQHNI